MKVLLGIIGAVVASVIVWWFYYHWSPGSGREGESVNVKTFDEFNGDLAKRVTGFFVPGGAADFQVVVTPVMDPIGTLYRKGRSVAFDDQTCVPSSEPVPHSMPNAFPTYQLDLKVAGEFGLDNAVVNGLSSAGVQVSRGTSFSFSVIDPQLKVLSDVAIGQLLASGPCKAVAQSEMVIVRGYVTGTRLFATKGEGHAGASASVKDVGKFQIETNSNGTANITDKTPQGFLQILSEIVKPTIGSATASLTEPKPVTGQFGKIFVQQDRSDDPAKGRGVVQLLTGAQISVERQVEMTNPKRTPDKPQVRYFNDQDRAQAEKVLDTFRGNYPDAVLVPLKIPAPAGQIEVWLPRVQQPR